MPINKNKKYVHTCLLTHTRMHTLVLFVLTNSFFVIGLSYSVVYTPSDIPLEKKKSMIFPLPVSINCQLCGQAWEFVFNSLYQFWEFVLFKLCNLCICFHSLLSSYVYQFYWIWMKLFILSHSAILALINFPYPLTQKSLNIEGKV